MGGRWDKGLGLVTGEVDQDGVEGEVVASCGIWAPHAASRNLAPSLGS